MMAVGAERVEVTAEEVIRELKKLGFSCIGKAVTWRNEVVTQELEGGEEGETRTVMVPRVTIVPTEDLDKATLDAIAEVSQQANGAVRVKMHDKHAALVSLGKHLGLFVDRVHIRTFPLVAPLNSASIGLHLDIECRRRSARRGCARDRVADDRGTDEKNRRLGHRDS
jgi:hypothetical protein